MDREIDVCITRELFSIALVPRERFDGNRTVYRMSGFDTWEPDKDGGCYPDCDFTKERVVDVADSAFFSSFPDTPDRGRVIAVPPYTESILATHQVEAEIERRGLQRPYLQALSEEVRCVSSDPYVSLWAMLRATPEQRCRAALRAVRGEG